jgi:hypothetical protein
MTAWAAASVLAGCFGSDPGEDLFTEPAGQQFEQLYFQFDSSGAPHILAVAGMQFRRSGPLEPWETEAPVMTRNYQTLHYTRSAVGFSLHPFRNLQNHYYAFPALLTDTAGVAHAFVSDKERIRQFRLGQGKPAHIGELKQGRDGFYYTNFGPNHYTGRSGGFALGSASTLIGVQYDARTGEASILDGERRVRLETPASLTAVLLEATSSFRLLVAVENASYSGAGQPPVFEPRTVSFHWKAGDTAAARQELLYGGSHGAHLSRYRHGYLLHLRTRKLTADSPNPERLVAVNLDSSGTPRGGFTQVLPAWLGENPGPLDADADGCLHGVTTEPPRTQADTSVSGNRLGSGSHTPRIERGFTFWSWNSCRPEWIDSLVIRPPADTALTSVFAGARFRLDAGGRPWMAFLVRNTRVTDPIHPMVRAVETWIGLAGYREGGWRIDTVAVK